MANSILAKTPNGELQITITIPATEIQKTYDGVVEDTTKTIELPGFRRGKAPKKMVAEKVEKDKIYEKVLQKVIPASYLEAIKEHRLSPIIAPKIEMLRAKEGEDWEIRATTCERPEISLGDYKEAVRKVLAPSKLWTPDKKPSNPEAGKEAEGTEKTQKVVKALLETVKIDLPKLLVEDELNRALASLIEQTGKLGLTIDQYLASIGKSVEQLREEYRIRVEGDLKLQFILDAVANAEKLEIKDGEIEALISTAGDEKIKQDFNTPLTRAYLRGILARRKALDFLSNF